MRRRLRGPGLGVSWVRGEEVVAYPFEGGVAVVVGSGVCVFGREAVFDRDEDAGSCHGYDAAEI